MAAKRRKRCKSCGEMGRWHNKECAMCRFQLNRKPTGRGNDGMGKERTDITPEMVWNALLAGESQASMARRWNVCQDTIIRRKRAAECQFSKPSLPCTSEAPLPAGSGVLVP
jgi:hypothetical protein